MPERTEQLLQFPNTGLYLMGPKRMVPRTSLRRALGVHESNVGQIQSRPGETTLYNLSTVHSLGRLGTNRFQGAAGNIYRNGVLLLGGNDGNQLTFQKAQPSLGLPDYLFLSGGGLSRKILDAGTIQQWGIAPPSAGLAVTANANSQKQIEDFEDFTDWTITNGTGADEATIKQQGTNSLKVTIAADTICVIERTVTLDLTTYGATASSEEDHIELWIRIHASPGFDYCLIRFDVGAGNFATDYYQFKVYPTQITPNNTMLGIGVSPLVNQQEVEFLTGGDDSPSGEASGADSEAAADPGPSGDAGLGPGESTDAVAGPDTWTHLRIPKSSFFRSGGGAGDWSDVAGLQFTVKTNTESGIELYLDDCELIGSAGLEGRYRYHSTFRNTVTGNRSNPEPLYVSLDNVHRQSVAGSSVQVSADTQVNQREIWRTVGNGTIFFRALTIDNNSATTFTDTIADYIGLNSNAGTAYLQTTTIQYDNTQPDQTYRDFLITSLTSFWLSNDSGKRGRLYYSPIGRPEGVKGFITLTSDNDILQRIILWNGIKFVFSLDGVYRVDGLDPYISRRVTGVPGVSSLSRYTVTPSPYGIWYQAHDGIRLFDGNRSELILSQRIGDIFRGKTLDYFPPFEGIYGGFFHNQYYISNTTRTLTLDYTTGFIRELGIGLRALFYEEDTQLLLGSLPTTVSILESESASPFTTFDIETGSLALEVGQNESIKRLRIKGKFAGQPMQPTVIIDDTPLALPPFTIQSGSVEYLIGLTGQSVSVRLQNVNNLTTMIQVEGIELDLYTPSNGR